jgi:cation-transporting ATPase 13A3/4/5
VLKSPLPNDDQETFNAEHSTKYVLFNGTTVLQTRTLPDQPAVALAYSTGFSTLKGELIRSIMFPKPTKFKFYRDSMRFVGFLALFALCGFVYTVAMFSYFGATLDVIVVRALDLVTITVPPALPVAMTIGTAFAISRLKTQDIYCISPSRVNVSGRIDTMCFDKTGTLTEEGLSVFGAQPMEEDTFGKLIPELQKAPVPLLHILASCHSLSVLNGQLIGDPLDVKMFEATHWTIYEPDNRVVVRSGLGQEIQIVRSFEFSSLLQRMSVIVKINEEFYLFAKGSPEMMKTLSIKQTLPRNFDEILVSHTHQGKRVLGLAMKPLPGFTEYDAAKISRQEAESELTFQGLLILQNQLKEDTADVIRLLQAGAVSNIMVTGDNEFTAISVARQCHIIKPDESVFLITLRDKDDDNNDNRGQGLVELYDRSALKFEYVPKYGEAHREAPFSWSDPGVALAINGKAFQHLQQNDAGLMKTVFHKAVVYSRMSPLHKAELVVGLQELGLTVGMCGDGANDCGALKAADVGLSLSDAEASVAAPFTSKQPTIRSLFTLLKEGRCALISSIQVYKYMACYSLLQSISIWILYSVNYDSRLRDSQFLWIDMGLIFPLSFLMGRTEPRRSLSKHRPSSSLLSSTILVSIVLQILIHCAFQVVIFIATNLYYIPEYHAGISFSDAESIKITVIFLFANFQYISTVVAYSINKPFRRGLHTNFPFFISILILTLLCIYLLLWPDPWTAWLFNVAEIKLGFRFVILAAAAVNFGIVYALEYMFIVSYMQNSESERQLVRLRQLRQNDRSIELQSMKV